MYDLEISCTISLCFFPKHISEIFYALCILWASGLCQNGSTEVNHDKGLCACQRGLSQLVCNAKGYLEHRDKVRRRHDIIDI